MKKEIEQEGQRLLSKTERLEGIEKQIDNRMQEAERVKQYNEIVDRYCESIGITYYTVKKHCFNADRGYNDYPKPERYSPDRLIEKDMERETERER